MKFNFFSFLSIACICSTFLLYKCDSLKTKIVYDCSKNSEQMVSYIEECRKKDSQYSCLEFAKQIFCENKVKQE